MSVSKPADINKIFGVNPLVTQTNDGFTIKIEGLFYNLQHVESYNVRGMEDDGYHTTKRFLSGKAFEVKGKSLKDAWQEVSNEILKPELLVARSPKQGYMDSGFEVECYEQGMLKRILKYPENAAELYSKIPLNYSR
jgi:hypothetical protein